MFSNEKTTILSKKQIIICSYVDLYVVIIDGDYLRF